MKIRNGWVGNSSSSSFILVGDYPQELVDKHGSWWLLKLEGEQRERAIEIAKADLTGEYRWFTNNDERKDLLDTNEDIYLTAFISDCNEGLSEGIYRLPNSFHMEDGGHGYPYDEDCFDELVEDTIWLRNPNKTEEYWRDEEDEE